MDGVALSNSQKKVLSAGLLTLVLICTYVPFKATYAQRGDHSKAYIGYSFLWSPPDPAVACLNTFGMKVYSWETTENVVHRAYRSCYSEPIFPQIIISAVAAVLATVATLMLLGFAQRSVKGPSLESGASSKRPLNAQMRTRNESKEKRHRSTSDLLLADLGSAFPISSGYGTEKSPLIVTAEIDYVSVEYAAAKHLFGTFGEEYSLKDQSLIDQAGRKIDQLTFDIKPIGSRDWTGQRSLYFDITAGFSKLGTH